MMSLQDKMQSPLCVTQGYPVREHSGRGPTFIALPPLGPLAPCCTRVKARASRRHSVSLEHPPPGLPRELKPPTCGTKVMSFPSVSRCLIHSLIDLSANACILHRPCPGLRALRQGLCPVCLSISVLGTEPGTQWTLVFGDEGREEKDGVERASGGGNGGDTFPAGSFQGLATTRPQRYRPPLCGEPGTTPGNSSLRTRQGPPPDAGRCQSWGSTNLQEALLNMFGDFFFFTFSLFRSL